MKTRKPLTTCLFLSAMVCVGPVAAQPTPVTLTIVPVGGNTTVGGRTVAMEGFFTTEYDIGVQNGNLNWPCALPGNPGASGTVTVNHEPSAGTVDPDEDGMAGPSSGGIPFLFGPNGLGGYGVAECQLANIPAIGTPPVQLTAGTTRYIGTLYYEVSPCAEGEFVIEFEYPNQPNLYPLNTRYREDSGTPAQGMLIPLVVIPTTLTVLPPRLFGDIFPAGGNGVIDVDDIYCGITGFVNAGDCPQADIVGPDGECGGEGDIDVTDLLHLLAAFIGYFACPCP